MAQPPGNLPNHIRVLVVEDEPRLRELLGSAISDWGFAVSAARSGEEALKLMQTHPSQVLVLDLNLPGMSGMECFAAVVRDWPGTQVIILTGFGDLDSARQAIHLNVVDFLTKPCRLGELEVALDGARRRLSAVPARLPSPVLAAAPAPVPSAAPSTLEELERQHILAVLDRHNGNRAAAAAELGISLRMLYYRLRRYRCIFEGRTRGQGDKGTRGHENA